MRKYRKCPICKKRMYRKAVNGEAVWMCLEPPFNIIYPDQDELDEWFSVHKVWNNIKIGKKICTECNIEKNNSEFFKRAVGYSAKCKECLKIKGKNYRRKWE